ncbi:CD225/dispanin family protein [Flavobacterium sp. CS20]|jgi:uncharacterized membrane protein YedE/YeeE|uniref:CD225/dispanin family protein n=1 Tax=Flavobacterium sp. CS20 TaxID=2775246 RepID=UPI001B39DCE4|nr:CD225/dispanin family protein [Flavobacterium sp. CS20]QTY26174.1 CD225/dispanin family protein [Flavobacterium sp. CS20]
MEETNQVQQPKPNNHMVMAIISTILPLITCTFYGIIPGIVSIVFASQVNSKYNNKDFESAQKNSKYAKIAWIIAIIITIITLAYYAYMFTVHGEEFMEVFKREMEKHQSMQ